MRNTSHSHLTRILLPFILSPSIFPITSFPFHSPFFLSSLFSPFILSRFFLSSLLCSFFPHLNDLPSLFSSSSHLLYLHIVSPLLSPLLFSSLSLKYISHSIYHHSHTLSLQLNHFTSSLTRTFHSIPSHRNAMPSSH